jgi:hypothetical protein
VLRALVLHGQQIDIALPGDIKYMSVPANELFLPALKTVSVNRASQINSLYNIHILSNALPAYLSSNTPDMAHTMIRFRLKKTSYHIKSSGTL